MNFAFSEIPISTYDIFQAKLIKISINRGFINRVTKNRLINEIYRMKSELKDIEKKYLGKLFDRIIFLRKEKGMSQEKLAIESEVARSLMRGYERKERNISFANLVRIIKFGFNMSIEEFFSEGFDTSQEKKKTGTPLRKTK